MQVDEIVGRRTTSNGKEDYLVRWQNYPPLLTTWEPVGNFSNCQQAIQEYYAKNWPIPGRLSFILTCGFNGDVDSHVLDLTARQKTDVDEY